MKTFIQFVTTPTADTDGTTILLHFDDKRYIFGNLPEGTQRACIERGVKLARVSDIFFTGKTTWAGNGGMIGMLLTLADALTATSEAVLEQVDAKIDELKMLIASTTKPTALADAEKRLRKRLEDRAKLVDVARQRSTLYLYGAPNLTHSIATGRKYICRKGMPICIREFDENGDSEGSQNTAEKPVEKPTLADDHIKVWALPILPFNGPEVRRRRKRSHEEFEERESSLSDSQSSLDSRLKGQITCQGIVSKMFNSDWRLDALVEMPLSEVSLPATLFVRDPETQEVKPYTGPKPGDAKPLPDIRVLVRKPWPGALIESLPPSSPSEIAMSYIIRNHDIRGKFDASKAQALGVQRGRDYGKLTQNQSVQSIDGRTITPDMVLGESRIGKGVAIVEIPTLDYIDNLLARPEWTSPEVMKGMSTFIWILGRGVGSDPRLQQFMARMDQAQHIISASDYSSNDLTFRAVAQSTIEYSEIDPVRYATPRHSGTPSSVPSGPGISLAEVGSVVNLEPQVSIERSQTERAIEFEKIKQSISGIVHGHLDALRQQFDDSSFQEKVGRFRQKIPNSNAEIFALGTGSSLPSMFRNVSGTLLRVPGYGSYLFDAGEGTLGQMKRMMSPDEFKEVLRDLKVIWLSHMHADHHLGTVSVIKAWYEEVFGAPPQKQATFETDLGRYLSEKRLCVVSDIHMLDWFAEYSHVENYGYDKILPLAATSHGMSTPNISSVLTLHRRDQNGKVIQTTGENRGESIKFDSTDNPFLDLFQSATGLSSILTVPVSHCQGAKAVSMVFPSGLKVSYSGDCRPCEAFTRIGQDSTVLIHEATFEDDMIKDALAKRHSTLSEALMVGEKMGAKIIVLTHFSQRYREMPNIEKAKKTGFVPSFQRWKTPGFTVPNAVRDIPANEDLQEDGPCDDNAADDLGSKVDADGAKALGDDVPVILAFDYMRLRLGDALHAEAYMPALKEHLSSSEVAF